MGTEVKLSAVNAVISERQDECIFTCAASPSCQLVLNFFSFFSQRLRGVEDGRVAAFTDGKREREIKTTKSAKKERGGTGEKKATRKDKYLVLHTHTHTHKAQQQYITTEMSKGSIAGKGEKK